MKVTDCPDLFSTSANLKKCSKVGKEITGFKKMKRESIEYNNRKGKQLFLNAGFHKSKGYVSCLGVDDSGDDAVVLLGTWGRSNISGFRYGQTLTP